MIKRGSSSLVDPDPSEKFLLPLLKNGPNNQYVGFLESIGFAALLNRTLVIPRFLAHYLDRKKPKTIFEFEEIFGTPDLSKIVRTISLEDFRRLARGQLEETWPLRSTERCVYYENLYARVHGFDVSQTPKYHLGRRPRFSSPRDVESAYGARNARFVAISCLFKSMYNSNYFNRNLPAWMKHFGIKGMYPDLYQKLDPFEGRPFVAYHFRKHEKFGCSEVAKERGTVCFGIQKPLLLQVDCFVAKTLALLRGIGAVGVYLAIVDDAEPLVAALQEAKIPVLTLAALKPKISTMIDENGTLIPNGTLSAVPTKIPPLAFSTLEQYICTKSKYFVGSDHSTWSWFVAQSRRAKGLKNRLFGKSCFEPL